MLSVFLDDGPFVVGQECFEVDETLTERNHDPLVGGDLERAKNHPTDHFLGVRQIALAAEAAGSATLEASGIRLNDGASFTGIPRRPATAGEQAGEPAAEAPVSHDGSSSPEPSAASMPHRLFAMLRSMSQDPLLAGVTVLDLTRVLAGPYCTRLLADLGARVIKIERPGDGDEMRKGYLQLEDGREDQSTYFIRINAGKLSAAVDLAHPDARPLIADLTRAADVVVENFLPGVVAKLGCDYDTLVAIKPDLVYCSISGFGQIGPWRQWPAFAHIIHAVSGMTHLEQQGDPAPRVAYLQAADVLAATHAFGAILAALFRRERTGRGAYLDVSMLEALIAAEDVSYGAVLNGGKEYPGPRPGMLVHRIGDRYLALQTVGAPQLWPRMVGLLGRSELLHDPRFATPRARREHWPEIRALIVEWLDRFETVEAALAAIGPARVPCAPVLAPSEVAALPQLAERHAFPEVGHPVRGSVRITAPPFHVDRRPVAPGDAAPYRPGEDTRAVLQDVLGYKVSRIEELLAAKVIATP